MAAGPPKAAATQPARAPTVSAHQPAAAPWQAGIEGPPRMPGTLIYHAERAAPTMAHGSAQDPTTTLSIKHEALEKERHEKYIQGRFDALKKLQPTKQGNTAPSDAARPTAAKSPSPSAPAGVTPPPQAPSG
eukprot:2773419-Pyramimonas_sp.AAC.1